MVFIAFQVRINKNTNVHVLKMAERGLTSSSARAQNRALLGEDDASMVFETSKEVSVIPTFDQMNLKDDLLRGIYAYGQFHNL